MFVCVSMRCLSIEERVLAVKTHNKHGEHYTEIARKFRAIMGRNGVSKEVMTQKIIFKFKNNGTMCDGEKSTSTQQPILNQSRVND